MQNLVILLIVAVYVISPIDFIPDVIPVLGWGDDLGAVVMGLKALMSSKK